MSVVRIPTNFNIELDFVSPPFHRRLFAWLLDMAILLIYLLLAGRFMDAYWSSGASVNRWAMSLLLVLPMFIYHIVCELTMNGQSFGKKLMSIKVISETGGRPSISQFVIRWLIRTADYTLLIMVIMVPYAAVFGTSIFWAFAGSLCLLATDIILVNSRKQQRLGDILAHTLLIDTRHKEAITDTVFLEVSENYVPSFPQVMQLSDRDINALKGILDVARKRGDHNMAETASQKIKNHLRIDTTLPPFDFLEVLLKDYNFLSAN